MHISNMKTLLVDLQERSYPIYIGNGLLSSFATIQDFVVGSRVMIVTNETIQPLYLDRMEKLLGNVDVDTCVLPDGETHKNLTVVNAIFDSLLQCGHDRKTTLIALGGGVVGDMTGFAAACYQRGVAFIQVPTTLLSQVDSSVGGKTGVNHSLGKNMIGAFHQPQAVLIDVATLATLPPREFSAGLAEIIKYGVIRDREFCGWLKVNVEALMARDTAVVIQAVYTSCKAKADIVADDEKESGIRAILNFGHTFGHAIETHQGYGELLHGEAVAIGMKIAMQLSHDLKMCSKEDVQTLEHLLIASSLPMRIPSNMPAEVFLELMSVDKKVLDGQRRYILAEGIGSAVVSSDPSNEQVVYAIKKCY